MLKDFSYEFCRGDKIGIVGFNGMGKSTFIRVISDQQQRNERRNAVRKMKKKMVNLENALEKLKPQAAALQSELERSGDDGWTVLVELTEKPDECNRQIDEKELQWLEIAEELEQAEAED